MGLPWHHVHVTLDNREDVASWYAENGIADRREPTKRSENLVITPNLLQVQGSAVAPAPESAWIDSIGLGVTLLDQAVENWVNAGAELVSRSSAVLLLDPFGLPFELVETEQVGFTHINIVSANPAELAGWYQTNLGGDQAICEWDTSRTAVGFDSMQLIFSSVDLIPRDTRSRPIDHLGWFTSNLDETFVKMSSNDVKFPIPPREFGAVRLAFAEDPCGLWFELLEPVNGVITK